MSQYVTALQVQQRYQISRSTIRRWQTDQSVMFPTPRKIGHRILWSEADLDAFDRRLLEEQGDVE